MFHVTDKRINEAGNAVFELWRRTDRGFDNHMATIEVRGDAHGGIKVLLGALTPTGKERAWDAIRIYELGTPLLTERDLEEAVEEGLRNLRLDRERANDQRL